LALKMFSTMGIRWVMVILYVFARSNSDEAISK